MPDTPAPRTSAKRGHWLLAGLMAAAAALVSACKSTPEPSSPPDSHLSDKAGPASVSSPAASPTAAAPAQPAPASEAPTALAYRKDAAAHLYALNSHRIYKGKLPSQLYAIGVLQLDIDRTGKITRLHWMRAPRHAPEVIAEIERTVRAAAPYPVPTRMGKVTYTDTWLWDKSGHFQLDTLTEGQL